MQTKSEIDTFAYMMAAEKMVSMISVMEQTMEFMIEYGIKPDEEVKKELKPLITRIEKWIGCK